MILNELEDVKQLSGDLRVRILYLMLYSRRDSKSAKFFGKIFIALTSKSWPKDGPK